MIGGETVDQLFVARVWRGAQGSTNGVTAPTLQRETFLRSRRLEYFSDARLEMQNGH
jgi:hypothetical protein